MKHPSQEILALHAGGDLGWLASWKTARHVAACERCADEVAAFSDLREALPELGEIPEVPWNRMAADMRANIRLGLAAGECVRRVAGPVSERVAFPRCAGHAGLGQYSGCGSYRIGAARSGPRAHRCAYRRSGGAVDIPWHSAALRRSGLCPDARWCAKRHIHGKCKG